MKKIKLDAYEQEIEETLEQGEFKSDPNFTKKKKEFQAAARYTLKLLKKIKPSIVEFRKKYSISSNSKANHEGLPYQTLIGSVLHKYANNTL